MDPIVVDLLNKLKQLTEALTAKTGVPQPKKNTNVQPSPGSPTYDTGIPPDEYYVRLSSVLQLGKYATESDKRANNKIFIDQLIPRIDGILNKYFKQTPTIKEQGKDTTPSEKKTQGILEKAKDVGGGLLSIVPAIAGLALAAGLWKNIDVGVIVKIVGTIGALVGGLFLMDKVKGLKTSIITFAAIILEIAALGFVLNQFKDVVKGFAEVDPSDLLKVGGIIVGIGGIVAVLGLIPKSMLIAGVAAFAGIELLILGLNTVLPPLATAIKSFEGVRPQDLGKIAGVLVGIGVIAGILGAIAVTGIGGVALAAGAAAFSGILVLAQGLTTILPPLAAAIKSLEGVKLEDMGKAGLIIAGVGALAVALGIAAPFVVAANLGMSSFSKFVDGISGLITKLGTTVSNFAKINKESITGAFDNIKFFMQGAQGLFGGGGVVSSIGNFVKGVVSGGGAAALLAPYILISAELVKLVDNIKAVIGSATGLTKDGIITLFDILTTFGKSSTELTQSLKGGSFFGGTNISALATGFGLLKDQLGGITTFELPLSNISNSISNLVTSISDLRLTDSVIKSIESSILNIKGAASNNIFGSMENTFSSLVESINNMNETVNVLNNSIESFNASAVVKISTDEPLKVDMNTTNSILYRLVQTNEQMVGLLKNGGIGQNTQNILLPQGDKTNNASGVKTSIPFVPFSQSPYNPGNGLAPTKF